MRINKEDRNQLIHELRRFYRFSYNRIGKLLGLSGQRIRQIELRKKREGELFGDFSVRLVNCLHEVNLYTPEEIINKIKTREDLNKLLSLRNFGRKSYLELEQFLKDKKVKLKAEPNYY